jgi:hypothetical protein
VEPSNITYKELFEKFDRDLSEMDSRSLDLQTIPNLSEDRTTASLKYIKSCQEILRALESKYRNKMAWESSVEWSETAARTWAYNESNYSRQMLGEAVNNADKKAEEFNGSEMISQGP